MHEYAWKESKVRGLVLQQHLGRELEPTVCSYQSMLAILLFHTLNSAVLI